MSSEVRILPYPHLVNAGVTQLVESQPSKLLVAGSSPVSGSVLLDKTRVADVAQLVEHILGKDEVTGSIPVISSGLKQFKTAT
jgi:hypothetical protein